MGWLWTSTKDASETSTQSSPIDPPPPPPQNPHSPQPAASPDDPSLHALITPTTTLPTSLSCRTAFDAAFHCQSLGGQFAHIYRYGSPRSCSELWGDFWFCVRTNRGFKSEERRRETVRAWALNREREKYGKGLEEDGRGDGLERKGSSEDVWEARRWKVKGAFRGDWGVLEREAREQADAEMHEEVR